MSRFDPVGMFWSDSNRYGILPNYDDSWEPPKEFPNLNGVKALGLDTETYDPGLKQLGPGWGIGDGHLVGVSLATEDTAWYFPMRHTIGKEKNLDPENVLRFLRDVLAQPCKKVGANLQYDIGWLNEEGVQVNGELFDVQFAEALIDDVAKDYTLETISQTYLKTGKQTNELYEWIKSAYGQKEDPRAYIYKAPPALVGRYAEIDALNPIKIILKQWPILSRLGLTDLFKLENKLIPVLIGMRMQGMRIDIEAAERAKILIRNKVTHLQKELNEFAGFKVGANKRGQIKRMFDNDGEFYPLTEETKAPSFRKEFLQHNPYKGAQLIYNLRRYEKAAGTFIENAILEKAVNDVIRPSLHPLRGEDGGAVSGRFSSSKPNGQQIPARDDELAPIIRGIFLPGEGLSWAKYDYSQIEYRFFVHFSESARLIAMYNDPRTDFHEMVRLMLSYTGDRTPVKNVNFGMIYGMGKAKLLRVLDSMGLHISSEEFWKLYHSKFPEAKQQLNLASQTAADTGEIRTILNRRNTFNLFEPIDEWGIALPYNQAIRKYGLNVRRALTHKALNRKMQGSSADLMKKAMVDIYEAGIFNKIGFPYITVHDELDMGYHDDYRKEFDEIKYLMENAIPLRVPVLVSESYGNNWGEAK